MSPFVRWWRHLTITRWHVARAFPPSTLDAIEKGIAAAERLHGGEIRFVVERDLNVAELSSGMSPRERAIQMFAALGVWDTSYNNGVLIYVLLADRDVEIVADRGFGEKVSAEQWTDVCHEMEQAFAAGHFESGALRGIEGVSRLVAQHFPAADRDELPNRPVML